MTNIEFRIPEFGFVELRIFDITGRLVRTLFNGELAAGDHASLWNGTDDAGQRVASGIYFYRLNVGEDFVQTRRMLLIK